MTTNNFRLERKYRKQNDSSQWKARTDSQNV